MFGQNTANYRLLTANFPKEALMLHRFSRTELLIGKDGLQKLAGSFVAVFGIGGVGSFTVEALARAGVGRIRLVDFDDVCLTNVNRQLHALDSTVGQSKVDLMRDRLQQINPDLKIEAINEFYSPDKGDMLLAGGLDYVVDAIDNMTGKLDIIEKCRQLNIPVISAMGAGNKLDPTRFEVADISETSVDPLAKIIRRELKKRGIERGIKVVYSKEQPIKPNETVVDCSTGCICTSAAGAGNCALKRKIPGSISFVPSVMGLILGGEVVRDLLGIKR